MNAARERLLSWDFQMRRESPEAALFGFFWMALVEETFRDQYPEKRWPPSGGSGRLQNDFYYLLREPQNPWWDDLGTPGLKESRDLILARAFFKGYRAAVKKLGDRYEKWQLGQGAHGRVPQPEPRGVGDQADRGHLQPRARSPAPGETPRWT